MTTSMTRTARWTAAALILTTTPLMAQKTPDVQAPQCCSVEPPQLYTVAVLDFEARIPGHEDLGAQLASSLTAYLSKQDDLLLLERAQLDELLGEQELGLSGMVVPETAARVGQLSGAKVLITGRVFPSGDEFLTVIKVMGTETSRVFGDVLKIPLERSPVDLSEELAEKSAALIRAKGRHLLAKQESPKKRIARLKKQLAGKELPTVSVRIEETHATRRVLDPAAETEVIHLLGQLGFTVLDPKTASERPDVRIVGEALSEFAMRRGNLVSCRGRVELRAVEREHGKVLAAERQTEVAVGLGELTAGKDALQNAAGRLVERLLPQLVTE